MPDALRAVIYTVKIIINAIKYSLKAFLWIFTFWQKRRDSKVNVTEG